GGSSQVLRMTPRDVLPQVRGRAIVQAPGTASARLSTAPPKAAISEFSTPRGSGEFQASAQFCQAGSVGTKIPEAICACVITEMETRYSRGTTTTTAAPSTQPLASSEP